MTDKTKVLEELDRIVSEFDFIRVACFQRDGQAIEGRAWEGFGHRVTGLRDDVNAIRQSIESM